MIPREIFEEAANNVYYKDGDGPMYSETSMKEALSDLRKWVEGKKKTKKAGKNYDLALMNTSYNQALEDLAKEIK